MQSWGPWGSRARGAEAVRRPQMAGTEAPCWKWPERNVEGTCVLRSAEQWAHVYIQQVFC